MADDTERFASELFPSDYTSWRYCIEVKCGLALTPEFLRARIAVLHNPRHRPTPTIGSMSSRSGSSVPGS
jgi:hypothetical protein